MDIKRIIKEFYEQFYVHKLCNLDEMGQFLQRYKVLKFTRGETGNLSRPILIKKLKQLNNNLSKKKSPGLDGFTGDFYQTHKGKMVPILYNLF